MWLLCLDLSLVLRSDLVWEFSSVWLVLKSSLRFLLALPPSSVVVFVPCVGFTCMSMSGWIGMLGLREPVSEEGGGLISGSKRGMVNYYRRIHEYGFGMGRNPWASVRWIQVW